LQNQDAFCCLHDADAPEKGFLFAISDGVSTVAMGQWAARLTCLRIEQYFFNSPTIDRRGLEQLIGEIDWELRGEGRGKAACTLSILWLCEKKGTILHVGDSAIYINHKGGIDRITHLDGGGSRLSCYMGMGASVSELLQVVEVPLREGDLFFLVTDGVDVLSTQSLVLEWNRSGGDPDRCALNLTERIDECEGDDDATIVVVQYLSAGTKDRVSDPQEAPDVPNRLM